MIENLPVYYQKRSDTQRQLAEAAASPAIAEIHHELATRYSKLAQLPDGWAGDRDGHDLR